MMLTNRSLSKAGTNANLADDQLNALLKWKDDMETEFDGVHRIRRILEEKVEILDVLDARTEQLTQQVQALSGENWMEQLMQLPRQEDRARSRGRSPNGRTPSPPQASGVWWTRTMRPATPGEDKDLMLRGSSAVPVTDDTRAPGSEAGERCFASPNFHGTGWAKSPPRRPISAGARPEVSHVQQAQDSEPNPQPPPCHSQEGPPTLESLGGWKAPAGAAHTICRSGPVKVRQGRRPMSAPWGR